jgi:hypothetical protein
MTKPIERMRAWLEKEVGNLFEWAMGFPPDKLDVELWADQLEAIFNRFAALAERTEEKAEPKGIIEELDSVLAGNKPTSAGGEDETNG